MLSSLCSQWAGFVRQVFMVLMILTTKEGLAQKATDPVAIQLKIEGDQAIEAGRFDTALAAYTKALSIEPTPALHYNRGRALQGLGLNAAALEEFENFRSSASEELKAAVPELSEMIRLVHSQTAAVTVTCDVQGATLHVRNQVLTLPLRRHLRLDPATIEFEVHAEGHVPWKTRLTLVPGEVRELRANLPKRDLRATLRITSPVAGAHVEVDGQVAGTVPVELRLSPGEHAVRLEHPAYRAANSAVVLRANERRDVEVRLDPLPAWYEKWWVWTGVGAIAVTGVVVGVALSTERSPGSGDIPPGRISSALAAW